MEPSDREKSGRPGAYLVFRGHFLHTTRRDVDVLAQPPKPGLAHDLHREASPGGFHAVADAPLTEVNSAVRASPELLKESVLIDGFLPLLILAPAHVIGEKAIPIALLLFSLEGGGGGAAANGWEGRGGEWREEGR